MSEESMTFGGFWKRFIAYVIDVFIIVVPITIIFGGNIPTDGSISTPQIIMIIVSWIYFAGLESSSFRATLGKMVLGLKVEDKEGERINFIKASIRFASKYLSSLLLMLGFIMAAFTAKKQGLHDFIAGTFVVNSR